MLPATAAIVLVSLLVSLFALILWRRSRRAAPLRLAPPTPSFLPEVFIVFDLETTGLNPKRDEIIEIGAIRVHRDSGLQETFQTLVKPRRNIPRKITELTGISQSMVDRGGALPAIALRDFAGFIGDLPLVAFNAAFDMAFLAKSARKHHIAIGNSSSCALKMARRAWPGRASYRLAALAEDHNLSHEGTHRALGDCTRTVVIYTAAAEVLAR